MMHRYLLSFAAALPLLGLALSADSPAPYARGRGTLLIVGGALRNDNRQVWEALAAAAAALLPGRGARRDRQDPRGEEGPQLTPRNSAWRNVNHVLEAVVM